MATPVRMPVAARTAEASSFFGREDELSMLDGAFGAPKGRGFLLVTGPSGVGKSALVARWIISKRSDRTPQRPDHRAVVTIEASVDDGDDASVIESRLLAGIREAYSELVADLDVMSGLSGILGAVSRLRLAPSHGKIIIVINDLDGISAGELRALLPFDLPLGVFFVCTARSIGHTLSWLETLTLAHIDLAEVRWRKSNAAVCESILMHSVMQPKMRVRALEMSADNALYAAIVATWSRIPAWCDDFPYGLSGFYDMIWSRIQALGGNRKHVRTGLGLLAVAKTPLPARVLAGIAGWPERGTGQDIFLDTAGPLIVRSRSAEEIVYSLRHHTTREYIEYRLAADLHRFHGMLGTGLGWPQAEKGFCSAYAVKHVLFHLARAKDADAAFRCGLDLSYVRARIESEPTAEGVTGLAADLQILAEGLEGVGIVDEFHEVVREEAPALARRPESAPMVLYNAMLARNRTESDIRGQFRFAERDVRLHLKAQQPGTGGRDGKGGAAVRALHGTSQGRPMIASVESDLKPIRGLRGAGPRWLDGIVGALNACALTRDGKDIVLAFRDGRLELRTVQHGELRWCAAKVHRKKKVSACAVTSDGRYVLTASIDQTMVAWRISDGRRGWVFRAKDALLALAVATDGRVAVTGADDGSLHVWSLGTGQMLRRLTGHGQRVQCCQISLDSAYVLSGSADHTLVIWDIQTAEALCTLRGHDGAVVSCAFGPDGRVLSVSEDGTLRVWEWRTEKLLCILPASRRFTCVCADSDNIWVGDVNGTVSCFEMFDSTSTRPPVNEPSRSVSALPAKKLTRAAARPRRIAENEVALKVPQPPTSPDKCTVLLVSANPNGTVRLRVDKEFRDVIAKMRGSEHRERFHFVQLQAARLEDLGTALLAHQPNVLHISAHGEADGSLLLEGEGDMPQVVTRKQLIRTLAGVDDLRLVLLNACNSQAVARELPAISGLAIGMSDAVADKAAISFAVAFYEALGFGRSVDTSFRIALGRLSDIDDHNPELFPSAEHDPDHRRQAPMIKV